MESLYQLLYVCLYLYLGCFTHIVYSILFFYQKRLRFIKTVLFFFLIACLWIYLSNAYDITFRYIYLLVYLLGLALSYKLLEAYLQKLNTLYLQFLTIVKYKVYYILKLLLIPPLYYYIRCRIYTKHYYRKHPWLKPLSSKRLF